MGISPNQLFTRIRRLINHPFFLTKKEFTREGLIGLGLTLTVWLVLVWLQPKPSLPITGTPAASLPPLTDLNLPSEIDAGSVLDIDIALSDTSLRMMTITSWGVYLIAPTLVKENQLSFRLDSAVTRHSGLVTIRLVSTNHELALDSIIINPLAPAEPLETYVGSKSIIADGGKHWAMITALPMDSLGNPVAEGTPTITQLYRPDGRIDIRASKTKNLVSYERINSGLSTGKTIIGVRVGGAVGKEKELLEIPGYPVSFRISNKNVYPFADERQNFLVETSQLNDKNGNTVAEGTLLYFKVSDPDGTQRLLTAYTLDGVARIYIQNPPKSGLVNIQASVYGQVESNILTLRFDRATQNFEVVYLPDNQLLKVGPMVGPLNQYAPDGSVVYAELNSKNSKTPLYLQSPVLDGYAQFDMSVYPKGTYKGTLRFNGIEKKVSFSNENKD